MDDKIINYCTDLMYHDIAMMNAAIKIKKLKDLNKFVTTINHGLAALALAYAVRFTVTNLRCEKQRKQIEKMSKDIEELKKAKGE